MVNIAITTAPTPVTNAHSATDVFPFLRLPPELRNKIYAYAFGREKVAKVFFRKKQGKCRTQLVRGSKVPRSCTIGESLALLRTCHQIAFEATPFLHENVELQIYNINAIPSLFETPRLHCTLKYIRLDFYIISELGNSVTKLARLPKLCQLSIYRGSDYHRLPFRDVKDNPADFVVQYANKVWHMIKKWVFAFAIVNGSGTPILQVLQFESGFFHSRHNPYEDPWGRLTGRWTFQEEQSFKKELEEYIEPAEHAIREFLGN